MRKGNIILAVLLLAGLCACRKESVGNTVETDVPISIYTKANADATPLSGSSSARILFFRDAPFHDLWIQQKEVTPNFYVTLPESITKYTFESKNFYTTEYAYPNDATKIHALGYAPDMALDPENDYRTLKVKDQYLKCYPSTTDSEDEVYGWEIDYLCCDGNIKHVGSSDNRFSTNKDRELEFKHLTSRITFIGRRDEVMNNKTGVRNVKITVHNEHDVYGFDSEKERPLGVPSRIVAKTLVGTELEDHSRTDISTFHVSELEKPERFGQLEFYENLPQDVNTDLGSFYLLSDGIKYSDGENEIDAEGNPYDYNPFAEPDSTKNYQVLGALNVHTDAVPKLYITVEAELFDVNNPGSDAYLHQIWEKREVQNWAVATGDKFLPGYEYVITITFNRDAIVLRGERVPWNDGGLHIYPVHPDPDKKD